MLVLNLALRAALSEVTTESASVAGDATSLDLSVTTESESYAKLHSDQNS